MPSVVRLKWSISLARRPPVRSPGTHGAKAKIATLLTSEPTRNPMTNVHTPNPAIAQQSITGNVTTLLMISACDTRFRASRLRSRLSDTMLQAATGNAKAKTGSTSARRGTANQSAITEAPRARTV